MLKKVERSSIKLLKSKGVNISEISRLADRNCPPGTPIIYRLFGMDSLF
ncbi:MAG: hypothetical protein ACLFVS_06285 [Candidatus Acetothermia bacterium]